MDGRIRVLYVDDEPGLCELARLFLEETGGFSVAVSGSVGEALRDPALASCDAIVSDYLMPGTDGIAFLKIVRERLGDIPFILFTGRGREEVVIDAINNGADFYLQKGGDPLAQFAELAHKIRQAVGRHRAERSRTESEKRLAEKSRTLAITGSIIQAANEAHSVSELIGRVLPSLIDLLEYDGGCVYLIEAGSSVARIVLSQNLEEGFLRMIDNLPIGSSPYDKVFTRGSASFVDDFERSYPEMARAYGIRSAASIPVASPDGIIGAINIASRRRAVISGDERDTIVMIARELGSAIARMKAEQALRESREMYRGILENMQDAYVQSDLNGIITMASPSAARLHGFGSQQEIIGTPVSSLYARPEQFEEGRRILAERNHTVDYICEGIRRDGTVFEMSLNIQYILDGEGRIAGVEGIMRDVSERLQMERAIKEANRKLSLLNSITRHDIINQLTALKGFTRLAERKERDPEIAGLLARVNESADTISRQIRFMKTYQELGVHSPAWFRLGAVIGRAGIPEVLSDRSCGDYEIFADPMLEKVFFNLFDNAARHGEQVTQIAVSCSVTGAGLVITVEDNGTGIEPENKEKIFEKGVGKNTGFGLFLSREILAITGITIRETGTFGTGARFVITVPKDGYRAAE